MSQCLHASPYCRDSFKRHSLRRAPEENPREATVWAGEDERASVSQRETLGCSAASVPNFNGGKDKISWRLRRVFSRRGWLSSSPLLQDTLVTNEDSEFMSPLTIQRVESRNFKLGLLNFLRQLLRCFLCDSLYFLIHRWPYNAANISCGLVEQ